MNLGKLLKETLDEICDVFSGEYIGNLELGPYYKKKKVKWQAASAKKSRTFRFHPKDAYLESMEIKTHPDEDVVVGRLDFYRRVEDFTDVKRSTAVDYTGRRIFGRSAKDMVDHCLEGTMELENGATLITGQFDVEEEITDHRYSIIITYNTSPAMASVNDMRQVLNLAAVYVCHEASIEEHCRKMDRAKSHQQQKD